MNAVYRLRGQLADVRPREPVGLAEMMGQRGAAKPASLPPPRFPDDAAISRLVAQASLRGSANRDRPTASVPWRLSQPDRYRTSSPR